MSNIGLPRNLTLCFLCLCPVMHLSCYFAGKLNKKVMQHKWLGTADECSTLGFCLDMHMLPVDLSHVCCCGYKHIPLQYYGKPILDSAASIFLA